MQNDKQRPSRAKYIATAGVIAALYAVFSVAVMQSMSYLAWGPVQFRVSEALTVLPLFFSAAVPGLTLGCLIANLYNLAVAGPMGWLDVVFGTFATFLGALWTLRFRSKPLLALAGPVITNALIVSAYLPILLKGLGLYQVPLFGVNLEGNWWGMYLFGIITVGFGQAVVVYVLGLGLVAALKRNAIIREQQQDL